MLFVFGGEYQNLERSDKDEQSTRPGFHFGLVHPALPHQAITPYIHEGEDAAREAWWLTQHHSHLYSVSDDLTTVTLVESSMMAGIQAPSPVVLSEENQKRIRRAVKRLNSTAPGTIHVWEEDNRYFWDDSEDHGGFDRNEPCGPFPAQAACVTDAKQCFGGPVQVIEGKPPRYTLDP